ncbi:MAG: hypothetical protein K5776_08945, partial [Lachnospiraceae bacterium]|nr:hypothetical protein [Lachnospiraceae bacterium]
MNTKTKRNFLSFLTTLMFLALVSVFCMPMMANAAAVHNAHNGHKNHTGWTAISNGEDLKTLLENGGSGYLTCDIKLNDFGLKTSSREIDLCLNGYKIIEVISEESMMYEYYYDIFTLDNGSTFNLYDESGNSGELTHSSGLGGAFFVEDGSFNMNGGNITKNNSVFGSGVNVRKGTFTMNGGKISGNTSVHGGGVYINYDGTFVLNDGIISNNSNKEGGSGAGVSSRGKFTMNGGTISGNTSDSRGGGVCSDGKFIMNGGSISKNTGSLGGGVCTDGTFTMKDGKITNNTSTREGGGVYADDMITITGGQIKGNKAKYGGTGVAIFSRGLITSGIVTDTILMDNGVHSVTYNPNQGTGDEITQYWSDTSVDKNIRANKFKRSGYSFYNWNTKADGSGTSYADKA